MAETNTPTTALPREAEWSRDITDVHSDVAQHVYGYDDYNQVRSRPWRGGINHFDGPHDTFCFLCNEKVNSPLLACQTCENCYHAGCTLPDWEDGNSDLPEFWFCDHCVGYGFSVPPLGDAGSYFTPSGSTGKSQTNYFGNVVNDQVRAKHSTGTVDDIVAITDSSTRSIPPQPVQSKNQPPGIPLTEAPRLPTPPLTQATALTTTTAQNPALPSAQTTEPQKSTKTKRSYPRSPSPPTKHRKRKSKYSPYSAEVEKALSVITNELEKSGKQNTSSKTLHMQTEELEQQLRMRDNEITLLRRENDRLQSRGGDLEKVVEKGKKDIDDVRRNRHSVIRERDKWERECGLLKGRLEETEKEGREWRGRLKELVGGDFNG